MTPLLVEPAPDAFISLGIGRGLFSAQRTCCNRSKDRPSGNIVDLAGDTQTRIPVEWIDREKLVEDVQPLS